MTAKSKVRELAKKPIVGDRCRKAEGPQVLSEIPVPKLLKTERAHFWQFNVWEESLRRVAMYMCVTSDILIPSLSLCRSSLKPMD